MEANYDASLKAEDLPHTIVMANNMVRPEAYSSTTDVSVEHTKGKGDEENNIRNTQYSGLSKTHREQP